MSELRRVEKLVDGEWVEIKEPSGLAALVEGDQFKLYEPDGKLVDDTVFVATGSPYESQGTYAIDADPVSG